MGRLVRSGDARPRGMKLDPRRNIAATAAGIVSLGLGLGIWLIRPEAPFTPARIALLAAGVACLVAGSWPSRRVRFVLVAAALVTLTVVGALAFMTIGFSILVGAALASYGLFIEYAREGRD